MSLPGFFAALQQIELLASKPSLSGENEFCEWGARGPPPPHAMMRSTCLRILHIVRLPRFFDRVEDQSDPFRALCQWPKHSRLQGLGIRVSVIPPVTSLVTTCLTRGSCEAGSSAR